MIQDKPIFWHAIFVTKGVMKFSILWLSNVQPILFPQFIHIIPTAYGTSLWPMLLSYQILILNIENNFNNDFKCSAGLLISYDVCNIITWKWNHCMSSIIIFGKNYMLFLRSISFLFDGSFSLEYNLFLYVAVSRLSFHSWINAGWSISFI